MKIKLPNGLMDGLDLFNMASIDELRGKQQNYLSNKDLVVGNIGHVPKILEDLVLSLETEQGLTWGGNIKEAIYKLPSGDVETILIKIRENTYGERFFHEADCPHCGQHNKDYQIKLNELELDVMTIDQMMDKASRTVMLPKAKVEAELKPLYLKDMFEAVKISTDKQDEIITSALCLTLKRLGDKSKVTAEDIEKLAASDISVLNDFATNIRLEGTIDLEIINECGKCHKEFKTKLNPYDPSFFYLTKGYKTTST